MPISQANPFTQRNPFFDEEDELFGQMSGLKRSPTGGAFTGQFGQAFGSIENLPNLFGGAMGQIGGQKASPAQFGFTNQAPSFPNSAPFDLMSLFKGRRR